MSRTKPLHQEVAKFVQHHLGRGIFAPHTGQDFAAWRAFVYLVECYALGGGAGAVAAMREVTYCAQPKVLVTFAQAIPAVMDWGDVARLWPQVVGERVDREGKPLRYVVAIERLVRGEQTVLIAHGLPRPEDRCHPGVSP